MMVYTYREVAKLTKKDIGSQLLLRRIEAGYMRLGVLTGFDISKYRVKVEYRDPDGEILEIEFDRTDSVVLGA
jgi:hypothetical protein